MQQTNRQHQVVLRAGDDARQVLILFVIAVEKRQLLLTVRGIVKGVDVERQLPRQPDPLVKLAERQQPGIAGNLVRRGHYHNRLGCEKIKCQLKSSLRNHRVPPSLRKGVVF